MSSSKKPLTTDQRFSRVMKDPRFWEMPEKERKIKVDKRFQAMFTDKKFSVKYTMDKRGRPIHHDTTEDLKRFYQLSDSSDGALSEEEAAGTKKGKQKAKLKKKPSAEPIKTFERGQKGKMSNEPNSNTDSVTIKADTSSKGKSEKKPASLETKQKPSKSITAAKKSLKSVEQKESEESGMSYLV